MKTIGQIAALTGISTRTLQYYDEIGLLKPSKLTPSGYRLYSSEALERLQQILFFKELGFKLQEIKKILEKPEFDKRIAYGKQKQMLLLKRNRIDRLIELLGRLEKGETCMSFKEFDLSEYIDALESFKDSNEDAVIKHWGSMEAFDELLHKLKNNESDAARLAIKQFGSVEKYTAAMKYNMEHFAKLMDRQQELTEEDRDEIFSKQNALFEKLTSDLAEPASCDRVQKVVHELVVFTQDTAPVPDLGEGYWDMVIESYSSETAKEIIDTKYGPGASTYIAQALQSYFSNSKPVI
ncbi:MerR family transcriptional regulator [Clostridiales Family XIII bacterium ASD5510]|uniref:MerR family transcriptional regulator n=1 Tax=Hominibacterium faecale TaxID=2839743 RepID=A0A9J6QSD2_9FIRM|nr:MerR family transcriptional regulator [Hominibacterium faecale]MCU7377515.1 MerR family transcriptional regulator [Hominibacterium faecale]